MADLYRARNRDRINAQRRKRYAADPTKTLAQNKDWRTRNAEGIKRRLRRKQYGTDGVELLALQKGKCAICEVTMVLHYRHPRAAHLDHDHKTGRVRGWLCSRCNMGIGSFEDRIELLWRAAGYLRG